MEALLADTFMVSGDGLQSWIYALFAVWLVFGGVTAAKGRWNWLFASLLFTGGLLLMATAWLPAAAGSTWERWAAGHSRSAS